MWTAVEFLSQSPVPEIFAPIITTDFLRHCHQTLCLPENRHEVTSLEKQNALPSTRGANCFSETALNENMNTTRPGHH